MEEVMRLIKKYEAESAARIRVMRYRPLSGV
jgi:hypothetical protein